MDIGRAYPGYDSCHYWPRHEENGVKYFLCSRHRDSKGDLRSFYVNTDTLEGALVMLNEKLRSFFANETAVPTDADKLTGFEQMITDAFLSETHTDLRTEYAA